MSHSADMALERLIGPDLPLSASVMLPTPFVRASALPPPVDADGLFLPTSEAPHRYRAGPREVDDAERGRLVDVTTDGRPPQMRGRAAGQSSTPRRRRGFGMIRASGVKLVTHRQLIEMQG